MKRSALLHLFYQKWSKSNKRKLIRKFWWLKTTKRGPFQVLFWSPYKKTAHFWGETHNLFFFFSLQLRSQSKSDVSTNIQQSLTSYMKQLNVQDVRKWSCWCIKLILVMQHNWYKCLCSIIEKVIGELM